MKVILKSFSENKFLHISLPRVPKVISRYSFCEYISIIVLYEMKTTEGFFIQHCGWENVQEMTKTERFLFRDF